MPLLLARRWQALRGAPVAIGVSSCARRPPRHAFTTFPCSALQTTKKLDDESLHLRAPFNSAIIIPNSVSNTQPADLIKFIQNVKSDYIATQSFCVFLVTPAFAQWLQDESFLENALGQLYSELPNTTFKVNPEIDVLCAVVDKVPIGRALSSRKSLEDELWRRTMEPPVDETGFEGMAYVTLPASASISSAIPPSTGTGTIDFIANGYTANQDCSSYVIRLPLANTIFQTGTPSSMTFSTWRFAKGNNRPELLSKSNVSHHGIRIAGHGAVPEHLKSALSIPLLPVTQPRRVDGCMGNIVRRVIDAEGKIVTASSELEEVVPRFFKSRGQSPHATTAWALIIPRSMSDSADDRTRQLLASPLGRTEARDDEKYKVWEQLWRTNPPSWNSLVPTALAEGARLHRILSGGGGWGKKAGLISLDPTNLGEHHANERELSSVLKDPGNFNSVLVPVIKMGDSIQFFLCPASDPKGEIGKLGSTEKLMDIPKTGTWDWELGTIPSTVDLMPSVSLPDANPISKVLVFQNTFGALAERGLTLTRHFAKKEEKSPTSTSTTVVDVPFSRFCAVELSDSCNSNGDAKDNSKNERNLSVHFIAPGKDPSTEGKGLALISSTNEAKQTLTSRTLMNQVRRLGTKIARLTSEYKAIMFSLHRSQGIRSVFSRGDLVRASMPSEVTSSLPVPQTGAPSEAHATLVSESTRSNSMRPSIKSRVADRRLQRICKRIKDLSTEFKAIKSKAIQPLYNPVKRMLVLNDRKQPEICGSSSHENIQTISIRNVNSSLAFGSRIVHATMIRITMYVSVLTEEYRAIMHTVRQRERRVKRALTLSQRKALYNPLDKHTTSKLLSTLIHITKSIQHLVGTLQNDFEVILGTILIRNDYNSMTHPFSDTENAIKRTEMDVAKISAWVSLRAHIANSANASALTVQSLDNALHWHLGHMTRDRIAHRRAPRSRKPGQELRSSVLRKYSEVLLFHGPRLTQQVMEKHLVTNEIRNRVREKLGLEMDGMTMALKRLHRQKKAIREATLLASMTANRLERRETKFRRIRTALGRQRTKIHGLDGRKPTLRRIRIDLRGKQAIYWAKKMQEDTFAAQVGSWLGPVNDSRAKEDFSPAKHDPFEGKVFGQQFNKSEDLESEEKQDGLPLLLMETAKLQEGKA